MSSEITGNKSNLVRNILISFVILVILTIIIGGGIFLYIYTRPTLPTSETEMEVETRPEINPELNPETNPETPFTDFSKLSLYCLEVPAEGYYLLTNVNTSPCITNISFKAFTSSQPNTIPVCIQKSIDGMNHSIVNYNSVSCSDESFIFYAYPIKQPDTIPICISSAGAPERSRLSYDQLTCFTGVDGSGWEQIGVFYAYPPSFLSSEQ